MSMFEKSQIMSICDEQEACRPQSGLQTTLGTVPEANNQNSFPRFGRDWTVITISASVQTFLVDDLQ